MALESASAEPAAFELINATGKSDVVLLCDHASNRIPRQLGNLGISPQQLYSHIALDLGAADVARFLSASLDAPLILSNYSRLVIDCNRLPESNGSILHSNDGIAIPGNLGLSAADCLQRRQLFFDPYHEAINNLLLERAGHTTCLLSIHSFTPFLFGADRPWHIGVCYEDESVYASQWLTALRSQLEVPVGDNQPYSIERDIDYTLPFHGRRHAIDAVMLEIRQDQISHLAGARRWSEIIARAWQQSDHSVIPDL